MNTPHTPGPWIWKNQLNGSANLFAEDGARVILCEARLINREANARLIAAAPTLLAALNQSLNLQEFAKTVHTGHGDRNLCQMEKELEVATRAAINLAIEQTL